MSRGEGETITVPKPRAVGLLPVCLTVKPVGKPDAGNPHVRFDERGRETGRCRTAQVTAPFLDSTKPLASDPDNEYMMIDATIVRAHQHSAGARKKTARKQLGDPAAD